MIPLLPLAVGSASNSAIGEWFVILSFILGAVIAVLMVVNAYRRRPTSEEYATKGEVQQMESRINAKISGTEAKIDTLGESLKRDFSDIRKSDEARASGLHKRVNVILSAVSSVDAKVSMLPCISNPQQRASCIGDPS